ncbi:phage tail tape measure protein, partial [Rhizobiaceae sp. 2RAB30]
MSRAGGHLKNFAAGFAGGFLAGGITGLASQLSDIAKGIATIGDEAKRAGLSTKAFQEMKYVAEQNRIGVDSLVDGLKELSLRADEWIQTGSGPAAEAFQRLGYTAAELKEKLKDPSALFTEIIGKLGELDKAAQIRVADEVFGGTGGEKFVQLIEQGERGIRAQIQAANDLGIVIDDELIEKAAEIDRKFQAVATTVGSSLKSAIVEAADALSDFIARFQRFEAWKSSSLQSEFAALGSERLDIEGELVRLRGLKPSDGAGDGGWLFGMGESTAVSKIAELESRLGEIAAREQTINDILNERLN